MILLKLPFKFNAGVRKPNWIQLAASMNIQVREHFGDKMKRKEKISKVIRQQMGEENFSYESVTKTNKKTKKTYQKDVWTYIHGPLNKPDVIYRRGSVSLLDPWDNFGASFKNIGDVIVELGLMKDDASDFVGKFTPIPHRVEKQKDSYIEVEIHERKEHSEKH